MHLSSYDYDWNSDFDSEPESDTIGDDDEPHGHIQPHHHIHPHHMVDMWTNGYVDPMDPDIYGDDIQPHHSAWLWHDPNDDTNVHDFEDMFL